ncbi:MAG TPA: phosphate uptake regulator PhoU [Thermoplasmata archaeon]|nr:phosphate uptake regulator PhoU [Thermoplasmata archaeon]
MELETRKVQKLGYSSLGVSLPKAWAESNGIRPGSLVSLSVEDDGTLRIRLGPHEEYPVPAEATIDADEWAGSEGLTRMITGNYIVGCNSIRVRSRDELSPGQLQEIHEAVRGLTGLTIVSQGPKFVTIENFVEPTRFPIDGLLRRLHYLTARMEKIVLGALAGDGSEALAEVGRMELEVDRLYWLVVRQLLLAAQNRTIAAKVGVTEPRHLLGDRLVAVSLENVGDFWEELAADATRRLPSSKSPPRALARAVKPVKDKFERLIESTMTSFFAMDVEKANGALDIQKSLVADLNTSGPRDRESSASIDWALRPIGHAAKYYGTIAQITINRCLESPARPRPPVVAEPAAP